jgi:hypothetical protein
MAEMLQTKRLALGSIPADGIPEGHHAAGFTAAFAAALSKANANELGERDTVWEVQFGAELAEGGSAKVTRYLAKIRVPADIDWH